MVNKNKVKGYIWERDLVEKLNRELPGKFKRVPASGSMGTRMEEGLLTGDVVGTVDNISNTFRIECKARGGGTQVTVKKEWLDKIKEEADSTYSIPVLACKFIGAGKGIKQFIVLDIDTFIELVKNLSIASTPGD